MILTGIEILMPGYMNIIKSILQNRLFKSAVINYANQSAELEQVGLKYSFSNLCVFFHALVCGDCKPFLLF